jgi:hypothetical protein
MPKKKSSARMNKLPAEITLSTGYKVDFDLGKVNAGLRHLARALSGEIFLETARQTVKKGESGSWEPSIQAVNDEISFIINGMSENSKSSILHAIIWDIFCREQGKISNKVNKTLDKS